MNGQMTDTIAHLQHFVFMQITFFPDQGSNPVHWTQSPALYHMAIKAGLYGKEVFYISLPGDTVFREK